MVGLSLSYTPAMGPSPALAAKPLLAWAWLLPLAPWDTHLGRFWSLLGLEPMRLDRARVQAKAAQLNRSRCPGCCQRLGVGKEPVDGDRVAGKGKNKFEANFVLYREK